MKYPDPCKTCRAENCAGLECGKWRARFLTFWKRYNGYLSKDKYMFKGKVRKAFRYEHPDVIRKYIKEGPCFWCGNQKKCDTPCGDYWKWWDIRQKINRRIFNVAQPD